MSKIKNNWSFSSLWNASLDIDRQRELVERDYVWASELGRGFYDRYWKMKGREPTTPPNLRTRRKFEAGNLMEWVIRQVLSRAGVLKESQEHIVYEGGPIKVTGRCDFRAGGEVTPLSEGDLIGMPENFAAIASHTVDLLMDKYPDGLREVGLEIKSCAAIMFDRYLEAPGPHHALQAFHYARTTKEPFLLIYVSRDDLRMCEWIILPEHEQYRILYDKDLKDMSEYLKFSEEEISEHKEPLLLWEDEKFKKNFEVEYSNYLTDYGFERPDEYTDKAKISTRLNNVVKSIKIGKKLSKLNLEAIELGVSFYPEVENILNKLKEKYEWENTVVL